MSKMNKPRLGRGLSSLLSLTDEEVGENAPVNPPAPASAPMAAGQSMDTSPAGSAVLNLPLDQIQANPHQPRREFDDASIAELAMSLKSTGVIQPVIVRKTVAGYELIAGERRLRAARHAHLPTIPAIVKEVDSYTQAQMALVENIQRQDLNPVDRANAYRALLDQLGLTHAELAGRLGEDRTVISHYLRLLELTEPVRESVRSGKLSLGHGKLLASISDPGQQQALAERVLSQGLSVRNLERLMNETKKEPSAPPPTLSKATSSAHLKDLEQSIARQLGMKVQVRWSPKTARGKMVIYYNLDQFDQLKDRLGLETE